MTQTGKVLITLRSGIELEIAALSLLTRNQLQVAAAQAIPLPDPKPYEVKVDGIQYAGDDKPATIPAEENPDYVALVQRTRQRQAEWTTSKSILICTACPDRDALIAQYQDNLSALRMALPEEFPDDWAAILKHFLTTANEYAAIIQIISQALPLTDQEVRNALEYFRIRVPGADVSRTRSR